MAPTAVAQKKAKRRTWQQDPLGRRERILEAAAREFGEQGYRAARLENIARAAGVSQGTIYHQFGSKHGLLVEVGTNYGADLARAVFGGLDDQGGPEEMIGVVQRVFAYVREQNLAFASLLLALDPLDSDAEAQAANREQIIAALERAFRRWKGEGVLPELDVRIAAELHFCLVESALRECFVRGDGCDEDRYISEVTRCLRAYIKSYTVGLDMEETNS